MVILSSINFSFLKSDSTSTYLEDDLLDEEEFRFRAALLGDRDVEVWRGRPTPVPTNSASAALKLLVEDFSLASSFSFLIFDKFISLFCRGAVFLVSSGLLDRALRLGIPSGLEDRDLEDLQKKIIFWCTQIQLFVYILQHLKCIFESHYTLQELEVYA